MKIWVRAITDAVFCFLPAVLLLFLSIYSLITPASRRESSKEYDEPVKTEKIKKEPVGTGETGFPELPLHSALLF
jgi:hypothetical protein